MPKPKFEYSYSAPQIDGVAEVRRDKNGRMICDVDFRTNKLTVIFNESTNEFATAIIDGSPVEIPDYTRLPEDLRKEIEREVKTFLILEEDTAKRMNEDLLRNPEPEEA